MEACPASRRTGQAEASRPVARETAPRTLAATSVARSVTTRVLPAGRPAPAR